MHCRLRLGMSDLKNDMFNRHLVDDPFCACGNGTETAKHYLLHCILFNGARAQTISTLPIEYCIVETLLKGNPALHININILIFETVQQYISETNRF